MAPSGARPIVVASVAFGLLAACTQRDSSSTTSPARSSASAEPPLSPSASTATTAEAPPVAPPVASFPVPASTEGCPEGMVRVEGEYCPAVVQECLEWHDEVKRNKASYVSKRCLKFAPSKCVASKVHVAYCMDRFEFPNRVGELPRILTSWRQAKKLCEADGKRLCTADEFNFACEGPEMLPYVYGHERRSGDPCNTDREYRFPDMSRQLKTYDRCMETPRCKAEIERLDQRERIGDRKTCVSWAGVYDLNGNVNEWVDLPSEKPPNRSGLKGGWWGPIRCACRPLVTFHKEEDYGYEQGFRCCKDASPG